MMVPTLIYGSVCWFNNVTNNKSLKNVQKRCTKWIRIDRKSNYKHLPTEMSITTLISLLTATGYHIPDICVIGGFYHNFDRYVRFRDHPSPLRSDNCLTFEHKKGVRHYANKVFPPERCL